MKKTIAILIATTSIFVGCSDKESKPRIPEPETLKTIKNVRKGLGKQCINFQDQYLMKGTDRGENFEELNRSFNLRVENGSQKYYFAQDLNEERLSIGELITDFKEDIKNNPSISGVTRAAIKAYVMEYVRRNMNKMIDFLIGGVDASGDVVDFTYNFVYPVYLFPDIKYEIPIKYSIDCFDNVTSFHIQLDDYAARLVYRENQDQTISVDYREINEARDGIVRETATMYPIDDPRVSDHPLITGEVEDDEYKTFVDLSVLRTSVEIRGLNRLEHFNQVYLALYNSDTEALIALNPNFVFRPNGNLRTADINLPLSALREYEDEIENGYKLIISSTYLKPETWRTDARYFPLARRERILSAGSRRVQTIARPRALKKCIQEDECNLLLSGITDEPSVFYPSSTAAGEVEFVFQSYVLPIDEVDQESLRCMDVNASCSRYISE